MLFLIIIFQSQLDKHLVEHREEQEGTRMYPCRQCSMEFAKHSQFREHMKQHNKVRYIYKL